MQLGDQQDSEMEMARGSHYSRGVHLVMSAASVVGMMGWERSDSDPDGLRFLARIFVWARWIILAFGLVLWVYRPEDWLETYALYVPGLLLFVGLNGYTHYRLARDKAVTRGWILLSIHDTTAQAAYMIGLGIDTAKAQAGDTNPELAATLEATSRLSRSAIWELRHPINKGGIYEGRLLSSALKSHAASFTNVTTVPCQLTQTGIEPPLSTATRGLLFSIAHNALTNAYRHAEASRVAVHLAWEEEVRLSVLDNGIGLPSDYARHGHGFANMDEDAQRLGGRLIIEKRGAMGGATVTCVIPQGRATVS